MNKFFIVGCPRSGTTMVQQALNRHSQIAIPPETKYFFSFFGLPRKYQARHVGRINADLAIRLPRPAKRVSSDAEGRAYYENMARQYVDRHARKGVAFFGEKTPEHTGRLPHIRRLFPGAKIIVLCRDGRDVASSLAGMPWMTTGLYANFAVWLHYMSIIQRERLTGPPDLHFVRYEDVVADPHREFAAMLRFLGAPYEPAVASGCGNREGVPEREMAWKRRALQPITRDRVNVFRRELSDEQIHVLERMGRHALPALGYPLLGDGAGSLSPAFYLKLAFDLGCFARRLPWRAVAQEALSRLSAGVSMRQAPSTSSFPAFPFRCGPRRPPMSASPCLES